MPSMLAAGALDSFGMMETSCRLLRLSSWNATRHRKNSALHCNEQLVVTSAIALRRGIHPAPCRTRKTAPKAPTITRRKWQRSARHRCHLVGSSRHFSKPLPSLASLLRVAGHCPLLPCVIRALLLSLPHRAWMLVSKRPRRCRGALGDTASIRWSRAGRWSTARRTC